jgi:hypothetical protein
MPTISSIALVNPISGHGHLDAYARLYSRAFIELGLKVVLLAEVDGDTADYLARTSPEAAPLFSFISFKAVQSFNASTAPSRASQFGLAKRARILWQTESTVEIARRAIRFALALSMSLIPEPVRRHANQLKYAIARRLLGTRLKRILDLSSYADLDRIPFQSLVESVRAIAMMPGQSAPDLILFLYLDLMAERTQNISCLDQSGAPWIGILFHPRLARDAGAQVEGYFNSPKARGGLFLVPAALTEYAKATPHLAFASAPDVADLELSADSPVIAREIRQRAGNRRVVLQIGSIAAHKDIPTFLDVIELADSNQFFFALIGEVHWGTFGAHKERIRTFYAHPPENVFVFEGYISNERDYNGVIATSDIIYAVYKDFSGSSNSLTKAAGLHRPILVSERSLMGERVRRFGIGETSPENNARLILERLKSLAARQQGSFGFDSFNQEHSLEALKALLAKTLPSWLPEIGREPTATSATL